MPRIESNYAELEKELDRASHAPGFTDIMEFETVLASVYATTAARVHVITGALRGSGKTASDVDERSNTWTGQMTWGGSSPGFLPKPHQQGLHSVEHEAIARAGVVYAFYEKRRGGSHDFMRGSAEYDAMFRTVFTEAVTGHYA